MLTTFKRTAYRLTARFAWRLFVATVVDCQLARVGEAFGHTQGWLCRHVEME